MLNDNEKPKGLPRFRGVWYLIVGIVIGVFGVLGVMFFLTMPSCACSPAPTPTFTLPYIPTPVPGATGTSPAHPVQVSALSPYRLRAFHVDGEHNTLALSYTNGTQSILETRPWPLSLGSTSTLLMQSETIYDRVGFKTQPFAAMASSKDISDFYDISFEIAPGRVSASPLLQTVYSDDGIWSASISTSNTLDIVHINEGVKGRLQLSSKPYAAIFNHVGDRLAMVTPDEMDAGLFHLSIYTVPRLHVQYEDTFKGPLVSSLVFSPDDAYLALSAPRQMYIVPQVSGSVKTFVTGPAQQHSIAFENTNAWVAVAGGNPDVGETSVVIVYTLSKDASQSSDTPLTEIVLNDEIIGLQYTDTLLIGHRNGIDSVNVRLDPPWTMTPLLSASEEGFIPAQ